MIWLQYVYNCCSWIKSCSKTCKEHLEKETLRKKQWILQFHELDEIVFEIKLYEFIETLKYIDTIQ